MDCKFLTDQPFFPKIRHGSITKKEGPTLWPSVKSGFSRSFST
ncbi:hypothetical protein HMPREF9135_2105 [Segatella baroniae F0067]|uniref:Uncharacterized protein n=1 Tax=Segatella baroniae F0067 TaxID=1115809 RepID=U2NNN4_9BACT|nr:hypothetical protein HMPREF9135_2105 [Segatella baroniae F0067]